MNKDKLLEKARRLKNCSRDDLIKLYIEFGFEIRHGAKHDIAVHGVFKNLRTTIARHKSIGSGYLRTALKLIEDLERLESEGKTNPENSSEEE